jgi:cytidine deaminase
MSSSDHSPDSLSASLPELQVEALHQQALAVAQHAYAPYSKFRVGAALLLTDGNFVTGCNVENASFRLTTCAEQTAIAKAISQYGPTIRIRAVVVVNLNETASQPCGACRQTIHEFSTPETVVYFPSQNGTIASATIADLLPAAFLLNE